MNPTTKKIHLTAAAIDLGIARVTAALGATRELLTMVPEAAAALVNQRLAILNDEFACWLEARAAITRAGSWDMDATASTSERDARAYRDQAALSLKEAEHCMQRAHHAAEQGRQS